VNTPMAVRTRRGVLAIAALGSAALLLAMAGTPLLANQTPAAVSTTDQKPDVKVDVQECATCHEASVKGSRGTPHASLEQACGSCHGDVSGHLKSVSEKGEPGPITRLKTAKPEEINKTCLACHEKGHQRTFAGSVHDRRDVSCTSCHSVHSFQSVRNQLKTARDAETCFQCHQQIRAKGLRTSHHPVREGKISCGDCHDPHEGTKPKMLKTEWITETCLTCHTEKRGPFLWEHAPVRENCALCHDPHGSNHDKLLVAKQPFLCQRCHLNTRHPGTLYDETNTSTGRVTGGTGITTVSNRAVEHACKNCHQNVHGGNAPSGPYLGR
jgi:DmsE family decaheme c-type cytochrome